LDGEVQQCDVTLDAWRIIKTSVSLKQRKERATPKQMRDACRGIGSLKQKIDLNSIQGKVPLSEKVSYIFLLAPASHSDQPTQIMPEDRRNYNQAFTA